MKLSIVTINYNDAKGLSKTLQSVSSQHIPDGFQLEHIIIDGGSTDTSVEIIREYEKSLMNIGGSLTNIGVSLKWISEKDKGVYNAMNKGIEIALGLREVDSFNRSKRSGDKNKSGSSEHYIQILNAGDILASDTVLSRMFSFTNSLILEDYPDLIYGNMLRQRPDGTIEGKSGQVPYSLLNYFTATLNHDCCWIKRSLFEQYGLYDENLKIVSDWKWFLQAIGLGQVKPMYVDVDMTIFDTTGISERNLALRNEERRKVLEELLPPAVLADYDKYWLEMHQVDNLKKRHVWPLVYFIERVLNKLEKWHILR